jgi:hypothetical protein
MLPKSTSANKLLAVVACQPISLKAQLLRQTILASSHRGRYSGLSLSADLFAFWMSSVAAKSSLMGSWHSSNEVQIGTSLVALLLAACATPVEFATDKAHLGLLEYQ